MCILIVNGNVVHRALYVYKYILNCEADSLLHRYFWLIVGSKQLKLNGFQTYL
jgi:hypothetical protein